MQTISLAKFDKCKKAFINTYKLVYWAFLNIMAFLVVHDT